MGEIFVDFISLGLKLQISVPNENNPFYFQNISPLKIGSSPNMSPLGVRPSNTMQEYA